MRMHCNGYPGRRPPRSVTGDAGIAVLKFDLLRGKFMSQPVSEAGPIQRQRRIPPTNTFLKQFVYDQSAVVRLTVVPCSGLSCATAQRCDRCGWKDQKCCKYVGLHGGSLIGDLRDPAAPRTSSIGLGVCVLAAGQRLRAQGATRVGRLAMREGNRGPPGLLRICSNLIQIDETCHDVHIMSDFTHDSSHLKDGKTEEFQCKAGGFVPRRQEGFGFAGEKSRGRGNIFDAERARTRGEGQGNCGGRAGFGGRQRKGHPRGVPFFGAASRVGDGWGAVVTRPRGLRRSCCLR